MVMPEGYREGGSLPTLRAELADYFSFVQAHWFNPEPPGTPENWGNKRNRHHHYTYADGATLDIAEGGLLIYRAESRLVQLLYTLGGMAHNWAGWYDGMESSLEKETLFCGTLAQAQAAAEALLARLRFSGQLVYALDMSVARIHVLGEKYNALLREGNPDHQAIYEYDGVTLEDECFYLVYQGRIGNVPVNNQGIHLNNSQDVVGGMFVGLIYGKGGIKLANVNSTYLAGAMVEQNELLTSGQALGVFQSSFRAVQKGHCKGILRAELLYAPWRKVGGKDLVLLPCWRITYLHSSDDENAPYYHPLPMDAYLSAVDGKILN